MTGAVGILVVAHWGIRNAVGVTCELVAPLSPNALSNLDPPKRKEKRK